MAEALPKLWEEIVGYLRRRHPDIVRGWFDQLSLGGLAGGILEVQAVNGAQLRYLNEYCRRAFTAAAQAATGRLISVWFSAGNSGGDAESLLSQPATFETEDDALVLNDEYVFENFVTGPCNRLAHAACVAVSETPGNAYNPLFIHGAVGLGKTHLLQAICRSVLARKPDVRVLYLSCETFTNHFIEAVAGGRLNSFRYRYRHMDVLVIDDIQFLKERERSQEEFFHTFNTLYQAQKQIVLSGDNAPNCIPHLEDRLVSRFNWGLVARIDKPCLETRMAIVRSKSTLRGLTLPEAVVHLLASRIESNTRELEGALNRLLALSDQYGKPPDAEIAREALGDLTPVMDQEVTIGRILDVVIQHYGVRLADLQGKRRSQSLALPRQICMYLARQLTRHSLKEIGGYFGGRDHTTVLHAARTVDNLRRTDHQFNSHLARLAHQLGRELP